MTSNHALWRNDDKFNAATSDQKIMSIIQRSKNALTLERFKSNCRSFILKNQIRHDSIIKDYIVKNYPDVIKDAIEHKRNTFGDSKKRPELELEFLKSTAGKNQAIISFVRRRILELSRKIYK